MEEKVIHKPTHTWKNYSVFSGLSLPNTFTLLPAIKAGKFSTHFREIYRAQKGRFRSFKKKLKKNSIMKLNYNLKRWGCLDVPSIELLSARTNLLFEPHIKVSLKIP